MPIAAASPYETLDTTHPTSLSLGFLTSGLAQAPFTRITVGDLVTDSHASVGCSLLDYDGDGDPDVCVVGLLRNWLYRNDGNFQFTKVTTGPIVRDVADSDAGVWADFDNDGFLDLYVCNLDYSAGLLPEPNFLYRNQGNTNAWIMIRFVGTVSNRAAIGARLRVPRPRRRLGQR
jgi:hypothetical protein